MPVETTLYDLLNVDTDATAEQIKKSFRKLALQFHPDKLGKVSEKEREKAEEKFRDIKEAAEILSDEEKRAIYDDYGLEGIRGSEQGQREMTREQFEEMFGGFGFPFGGMDGVFGRKQKQKKEVKMPDIVHRVNLSLKDVYQGLTVEIEVTRYDLKPNAKPSKDDFVCKKCNGEGVKTVLRQMGIGMMQQSTEKCILCNGEGSSVPKDKFEAKSYKFSKSIPKGVVNGEQIIIPDKGNEIPECFNKDETRTNIVLDININPEFTIDGFNYRMGVNRNPFDLLLRIDVEPYETICGNYKQIIFIDGRKVCIKIPQGCLFKKGDQKEIIVVVPKLGLPYYKQKNNFGDLYVVLNVKNSVELDESQLKQLWNIFTKTNMTAEHKKILAQTDGSFNDSVIIDEYGKTKDYSASQTNFRNFQRNQGQGGQREQHQGGVGGCAQQ